MLNFDDLTPKYDSVDQNDGQRLYTIINSINRVGQTADEATEGIHSMYIVVKQRLQQARHFHRNMQWLQEHYEELYNDIHIGILSPPLANDAVTTLFEVGYYVFMQKDHDRWTKLLSEGLGFARVIRDEALITKIYALLGHGLMMDSKTRDARLALYNALNGGAKDLQSAEISLLAYLGLLRAETFEQTLLMTPEKIAQAEALAAELNDYFLTALLHTALAGYYMHRHNLTRTLEYSQMALGYWYQTRNHVQIARTMMALAPAYRLYGKYTQANLVLKFIHRHVGFTQDPVYKATVAYEQGVVDYYLGNQESAETWLSNALVCYLEIKSHHMKTMTEHSLGLVYGQMGQYDAAQKMLTSALTGWKKLENLYEQASALYDLGEIALKRKQISLARKRLYEARAICESLPIDNPRTYLEKLIGDLLSQLPA